MLWETLSSRIARSYCQFSVCTKTAYHSNAPEFAPVLTGVRAAIRIAIANLHLFSSMLGTGSIPTGQPRSLRVADRGSPLNGGVIGI